MFIRAVIYMNRFYYYLLPMITLIQRQFRLGPEHGTGLVVLLADHQPHVIPVAHFYRGETLTYVSTRIQTPYTDTYSLYTALHSHIQPLYSLIRPNNPSK